MNQELIETYKKLVSSQEKHIDYYKELLIVQNGRVSEMTELINNHNRIFYDNLNVIIELNEPNMIVETLKKFVETLGNTLNIPQSNNILH